MHDRRGIRTARDGGGSIRGIAREFGASRNAVRRAIDPDAALDYGRPSMAEEYAPAVHDVLADHPRLSVPQIAELIEWPGSRRALSDLVASMREEALDRAAADLSRPSYRSIDIKRPSFRPASFGRVTFGRLHGQGAGVPKGSS